MKTVQRQVVLGLSIAVLASLALAAPAMAQGRASFPVTPIPAELRPSGEVSQPLMTTRVSPSSPPSGAVRGAIVGGVIGAIAGGLVFHSLCSSDGHSSCTGSTIGGAAAGAVVFGVLGGIIASL